MAEIDDTDYRNVRLRDGRLVGDVIHEQRQGLLNTWRTAQAEASRNPSIEPSYPAGYAAGRALADFYNTARSGGPIDFKNQFQGKTEQEADKLGRAGNFAYYAVGDGIVPRGLLDFGAAGYALWQLATGRKKSSDITLPRLIDKRANAVRDKALSLPDDPQ
jgi:hypothetical protein